MPDRDSLTAPRVILIDDHHGYIKAIGSALRRSGEVELVGIATTGEAGVVMVGHKHPDVALVDLRLPRMSGHEVTRAIKSRHAGVEVIALTVSDEQDDLLEALRAGARGYVLKNSEPAQVIEAIFAAMRGEAWLSPRMAAQLIREFTRLLPSPVHQRLATEVRLTTREQGVLRQLALGKTNRQISETLNIAETTVKTHLKNILEKLHVRNRLEAALIAMNINWDEDLESAVGDRSTTEHNSP
jgi:DNA-binding NarL/FixJ family response regulator